MQSRAEKQREQLSEELAALERQAGIDSEAIHSAAVGLPDLTATPDEYFESKFYRIRDETRRAYFAVRDLDLRKRLIGVERRLHISWLRSWDADVLEAVQAVRIAEAAVNREPWGQAAFIGGGCVAVGYYLAGLAGTIGGAVVGLFMGAGTIANAKADARREINAAQQALASIEAARQEMRAREETFSVDEELSGEPESGFEKALYANRRGG